MKLHLAVITCAALTCSCDEDPSSVKTSVTQQSGGNTGRIVVISDNAPTSDDEALRIVGIAMAPPPEVLFRSYQGGLDDNMKLVIRFSEDRMKEFWSGSPWNQEDAEGASGDGATGRTPRISAYGDPMWLKWKSSSTGQAVEASLPNGESARVYLAEDAEKGFIHAFIFWHET